MLMDSVLTERMGDFLKSLGLPNMRIHESRNHFDFSVGGRRMLVVGPMGSGKTEFSAGIWRDAKITMKKSSKISVFTSSSGADRRKVFFIRSLLDNDRFPDYPENSICYRGGYQRCGKDIASVNDSFDLEITMRDNPEYGTWIIDESSFYDERLAYITSQESCERGINFIFPSLLLNFRKEIFNNTSRLLIEKATDIISLTAYCEHSDCLTNSHNTYRYYQVDDKECPALYFDPLIIVGGDRKKDNSREPNYCTRCDKHHYLPGKEYSYSSLKPLAESAMRGDGRPLNEELDHLKNNPEKSLLHKSLKKIHIDCELPRPVCMNALKVDCLAERALIYIFAEQNLIGQEQFMQIVNSMSLDRDYIEDSLRYNRKNIRL